MAAAPGARMHHDAEQKRSWRRERDSNPRGLGGPCGFQDRSVQPLRHPSAWAPASLSGVSLLVDVEASDGDHD